MVRPLVHSPNPHSADQEHRTQSGSPCLMHGPNYLNHHLLRPRVCQLEAERKAEELGLCSALRDGLQGIPSYECASEHSGWHLEAVRHLNMALKSVPHPTPTLASSLQPSPVCHGTKAEPPGVTCLHPSAGKQGSAQTSTFISRLHPPSVAASQLFSLFSYLLPQPTSIGERKDFKCKARTLNPQEEGFRVFGSKGFAL